MTTIKETYLYESEERRIKGCICYRQFRLKAGGKFICICMSFNFTVGGSIQIFATQ